MADIGNSLATLLGGNYVNLFNLYGRSYQVIPQVPREFRLNEDWLTRYQVRTNDRRAGAAVERGHGRPSRCSPTRSPISSSSTRRRCPGVPFPGRTVGEAIDFLKTKAAEKLPEGFTYDFQGESRQYVQEGSTLVFTFVFALDHHLSGAGRAIRELPRSADHPDRAADRDLRRAASRSTWARHHQHLHADRAGDADRADLQARHPDGRLRQPPAGEAGL